MPEFVSTVFLLLYIIYIEGILSIDNAAVLGAMVSGLPTDQPIPWPRGLGFLAAPTKRLLGMQQVAALKVGLLGAYLGRGLMLFFANLVIHNPLLKLIGGLYLIKLAFENLGEAEPGEEEQVELGRMAHKTFWGIVLSVELADLAFSLDNVVAVVAIAPNNFPLVLFGVAMGILTMRFAAGIFARLITREPILKPAAYVLVLNIGVELLLEQLYGFEVNNLMALVFSASTLVFAVLYAHLTPLHFLRPIFKWLGEGMANVNELFEWALKPFRLILQFIFNGIAQVGHRFFPRAPQSSEPITVEIAHSDNANE